MIRFRDNDIVGETGQAMDQGRETFTVKHHLMGLPVNIAADRSGRDVFVKSVKLRMADSFANSIEKPKPIEPPKKARRETECVSYKKAGPDRWSCFIIM